MLHFGQLFQVMLTKKFSPQICLKKTTCLSSLRLAKKISTNIKNKNLDQI